jgi:hypothetical protein
MSRLGIASETGLVSIWRTGVEANLDCVSLFAPSDAGHFSLKPASYSIYTQRSPQQRARIYMPKPTAVWWNR